MAAERVVLRRRHSAELKAVVLQQCAAPGASVAKVAMSHGVNANVVHGWRKLVRERDGAALPPPGPALPTRTAASVPQFLPVSMVAGVNYLDRRPATTILAGWKRGMISL